MARETLRNQAMNGDRNNIRNLGAWIEALSFNIDNGGEITEQGMRDIKAAMVAARGQMIDDELLIKASKATFYDAAELPPNVVRLRK